MENMKLPSIQGFRLSITSKNSILHLEAEEESSGRLFTISLDSDSIVEITHGLFDNAEKMAQGLKDAATGNCPELKITIDSQGKLTYSAVFSAGVIHKEFSFGINLTEIVMEPEEVLKKRLNVVEKWKEEHEIKVSDLKQAFEAFQGKSEEKFNKLENMILQMGEKMNQRFDTLEKLYEAHSSSRVMDSQKEELKKSKAYFNDLSLSKSNFDYDSERTTVRTKLSSMFYPCLEIVPQIPKTGQHSYSFKTNEEQGLFFVGITTKIDSQDWNREDCNYRYWTHDGQICGRAEKETNVDGPFGGTGEVVKMVVDMDNALLTFFVDEKEINSCEISTSETYFAYVSVSSPGESVTLI